MVPPQKNFPRRFGIAMRKMEVFRNGESLADIASDIFRGVGVGSGHRLHAVFRGKLPEVHPRIGRPGLLPPFPPGACADRRR